MHVQKTGMSYMGWIRLSYGVPAKRGRRVEYSGGEQIRLGTIKSARGGCLNIMLDGDNYTQSFHPTWMLRYLVENGGA